MEKGYYQLVDKDYMFIDSTTSILEAFSKGILFEFDGFLFRKVEYVDPYNLF